MRLPDRTAQGGNTQLPSSARRTTGTELPTRRASTRGKLLAIVLQLVLTSGAAFAQVTSVGPFVGAHREDFESLPIVTSSPCYPAFILGGTAELCAANQGNVIVTGTSNCACGVAPQQGSYQAPMSNALEYVIQ